VTRREERALASASVFQRELEALIVRHLAIKSGDPTHQTSILAALVAEAARGLAQSNMPIEVAVSALRGVYELHSQQRDDEVS
jgi:hypothetical protein